MKPIIYFSILFFLSSCAPSSLSNSKNEKKHSVSGWTANGMFVTCEALDGNQACPAVWPMFMDVCHDAGFQAHFCSSCEVICSGNAGVISESVE